MKILMTAWGKRRISPQTARERRAANRSTLDPQSGNAQLSENEDPVEDKVAAQGNAGDGKADLYDLHPSKKDDGGIGKGEKGVGKAQDPQVASSFPDQGGVVCEDPHDGLGEKEDQPADGKGKKGRKPQHHPEGPADPVKVPFSPILGH